jgi:hypothetical protein
MLDALTKAEELITHAIGDTPEARETLREIRRARREYLDRAVEVDVSCRCFACSHARATLARRARAEVRP